MYDALFRARLKCDDTAPGNILLKRFVTPSQEAKDQFSVNMFMTHSISAFSVSSCVFWANSTGLAIGITVEDVGNDLWLELDVDEDDTDVVDVAWHSSFTLKHFWPTSACCSCLCLMLSAWLSICSFPELLMAIHLLHSMQTALKASLGSCSHQPPIRYPCLSFDSSQLHWNLVFPCGMFIYIHCGNERNVMYNMVCFMIRCHNVAMKEM